MKSQFKKVAIVAVLSALAFPLYAQTEPNEPATAKVQPPVAAPQPPVAQNRVSQESRSHDQIEAELGKEYYKDCVQNLKWALGIVVVLLLGFVGYAIFKSGREYKEALREAKEACKEARAASDRAREYEEKARERLSSLDALVGSKLKEIEEKARERLSSIDEATRSKLKEIEEKGKILITNQIQEAEKQREASRQEAGKQRKISELWNEGLLAQKANDFESASKYCRQIVEDLKFEDESVYYNWANALSDLARRKASTEFESLFRASFEKYGKAVQLKADFHEAYCNWGNAISDLAERKGGAESESLFHTSFEKYEKAVHIKPDDHEVYNNWGAAIGELAKRKEGPESEGLFKAAFEKFEKAVQIKPDFDKAYNNWGAALLDLAKGKDGENRRKLLEEAKQKCLKAESIKEGSGAYNLACVNALLGDETECRKWLETSGRFGTLPTRGHATSDPDLESVRDKEWFKQIHWAQKGN